MTRQRMLDGTCMARENKVVSCCLFVHNSPRGWWEEVRWAKPEYKKGAVNRAGEALITLRKDDPARERAITIVDNWRSCHAYPLLIIRKNLAIRAKHIDKNALIAQRLKRRPSIELKLRQNPNMDLSQMQDIAGCRAVVSTVKDVKKLIKLIKERHIKSPKNPRNPESRAAWDGSDKYDYIKNPKDDGYRSVHLIFIYKTQSQKRKIYNGQRIEIQIRSRLQHLWATAVETAQVFTGQALKSKIKDASENWLRFFVLTSSVFALREKSNLVPGTPLNEGLLFQELYEISNKEKIMDSLWGLSNTIQHWERQVKKGAKSFLLVLDPAGRNLTITPFEEADSIEAQEAYKRAENESEGDPNKQVVLVSVDSVDALRNAYPNYYADTRDFIAAIHEEIISHPEVLQLPLPTIHDPIPPPPSRM